MKASKDLAVAFVHAILSVMTVRPSQTEHLSNRIDEQEVEYHPILLIDAVDSSSDQNVDLFRGEVELFLWKLESLPAPRVVG